jgi:hypothetical protein
MNVMSERTVVIDGREPGRHGERGCEEDDDAEELDEEDAEERSSAEPKKRRKH